MMYSLFVSCPKGLEYLLEEELKALGLVVRRVSPQGVYGDATLTIVYLICIGSRIANRVQLILFNGQAHNEQTLYKLCHQFPWQTVFYADKTFAVEFHGSSEHIRNTMFGAQVVKDAIVDHFRTLSGTRPSIERHKPCIVLHAYLKHDTLTVSFDLTGYSMHQRGYRLEQGHAPIKENVAAAMLIRANWPALASAGHALHDPFCGSGTLVIEAAMMAANILPGLLRHDQSLQYWRAHQPSLWEKIRAQSLKQVKPTNIKLLGTDVNEAMIKTARANAERAGVSRLVSFEVKALKDCKSFAAKGLVVCNPPYGERLSDAAHLIPLYQQLGHVLYEAYSGWHAAFLTSNPMLAKATGLRAGKQYTLFNGSIECKLYCLTLTNNRLKSTSEGKRSSSAQMFANRLQKNVSHLQKWAKRNHIDCYRVYDSDLPEYPWAIDVYDGHAVLQEYAPPASVPEHKADLRRLDVMQVVPHVLNIPSENMVIKQRRLQKGKQQYQKLDKTGDTLIVREGNVRVNVNLYDYLDTGLFLDHRLLRLRFAMLSKGTRFLNCFCYTAVASVHAAMAGAYTTNVDLSNTYLNWARNNFKINRLDVSKHRFLQENCLQWLKKAHDRFDVIFLDPPSFSNSKRMPNAFDVQRDHVELITNAMRLLSSEGSLYFSTNLKRFKLSPALNARFEVDDITQKTIDVDFKRNSRVHQCYVLKKKE